MRKMYGCIALINATVIFLCMNKSRYQLKLNHFLSTGFRSL